MKEIIILLDIDDTLILTSDSKIEFNEGLIQILVELKKEYNEQIKFYYLSSYQPQIILQTICGIGVTAENLKKTKFRINVINELQSKGIQGEFFATMSPRVDENDNDISYGSDLLNLEKMALNLSGDEIKTLQEGIIKKIFHCQFDSLSQDPVYNELNQNISNFIKAYEALLKKEKKALSLKDFSVDFMGVSSSQLPQKETVIQTKAEMLLHVFKKQNFNEEEHTKVVFFDDKDEVINRMKSLKEKMPSYIKLEAVKIPVSEVFFDYNYNNLLENLLSKIYCKDQIDFPASFKEAEKEIVKLLAEFERAYNSDSISNQDVKLLKKLVFHMNDTENYETIIDYFWGTRLKLINETLSKIRDDKIKKNIERLSVLFKYKEKIIKYRIELLFVLNKKNNKKTHEFVIELYNVFLNELGFSQKNRISIGLFKAYKQLKENNFCDIDLIKKVKEWIDVSKSKLSIFLQFINNYENESLKNSLNKMIEDLKPNPKFLVFLDKYEVIKKRYQKLNVENDDKFKERYNAVCARNSEPFFQSESQDNEATFNLLGKYFENMAYRRLANYLDKKLYLKETTTFDPFLFYRISNPIKIQEAAENLLKHIENINNTFSPEDLKIIKKSSVSMIYDEYVNEKETNNLTLPKLT